MKKKTRSVLLLGENDAKVKTLAEKNSRSFSNQLNLILQEYFKND